MATTIIAGAQVGPSGDKGPAGNPTMPVGSVLDFAGPTAPNGWLLCYGQLVSRTTFSVLFSIIGAAWGAGDGSTTFGIPDLRGIVLAGKDDMGGSAAGRLITAWGVNGVLIGAIGGSQAHILTTPQMPSHTHTYALLNAAGGGAGYAASTQTYGQNLSGSTGGDQSHPNVQPTAIVNKIIFTGVFS